MSRWFRLYEGVLDDPKVQRLKGDDFKAEFNKAIKGQPSAFSGYVFLETGRLPWSEWALIRLYVFQRDDYTCRYCGVSGVRLECDHIVPLSKGGSHDKRNLAAACTDYNRKKSNKLLDDLGWSLIKIPKKVCEDISHD